MEGNECYKFSTIKNYVAQTHAKDIEVILDIGANVGAISLMMHAYFPSAKIYCFEAVPEYFRLAHANTRHIPNVNVFQRAVTSQHLFVDDLGEVARDRPVRMRIMKGLPEAGPGWGGGSLVLPEDHTMIQTQEKVVGFEKMQQSVRPITLDRIVRLVLRLEKAHEIDLIKMDCEGCECCTLGCATLETLRRVRFITGEYHGIKRFFQIMQRKLFQTHKVSLIGDSQLGAFFAERLEGEKNGILNFNKEGMLMQRSWLCDIPIEWHHFNVQYVLPQDRVWHSLP